MQGTLRTLESGELQLSLRPSSLAALQLPQQQSQGKEQTPVASAGRAGQLGSLGLVSSLPLQAEGQTPLNLAEVLVRAANAAAAEAEASGSGRRSDPYRCVGAGA